MKVGVTIDKSSIKVEKKNQTLNTETIDSLLNKEKVKNKKKENKENESMFTSGLSYEKIDHNKYKKALTNFNHLFGKDLNKINKNKKGIEKNDKNVQISKSYLYERALYKDIEIEINLENNNNKIIKDAKKIILLLNNFLNSEKNFFYYEFSNTRNISFNKLSEGDFLLYKSFIKEFDNLDNNSRNKEDYIKQLDYVNTMINLYYKFNINKKAFYIMTPLYSLSFDYNKEIPLLLTNSKTLEIELNKNDIKIIKIKTKLGKNKLDINNNKEEIKNIEAKNDNNNINNKQEINEEETNEIENIPLGVSKLYSGLLYNYFANQNKSNPFNIFSNFEFEGGIFRKCKFHVINIKSLNAKNDNILVKIEGIIFEENINKIVNFIKNELSIDVFSVRLNKIKATSSFYLENKEIVSNFNKFDFKKDNFYFYKQ